MKLALGILTMTSMASTFAFASANSGAPELCPKYRCVAEGMGSGHGNPPGYGYADDLEEAKRVALQNCEISVAQNCAVTSCENFTGPVIKIFNSCQSQW